MISNIIPTHNRRDMVLAHLRAIPAQSLHPSGYEVIVVCDSCTDGTADEVRRLAVDIPYSLQCVEVEYRNRGRTRNAGFHHSVGDVIVFNDDDVIPTHTLFEQYHRRIRPGIAGMGYVSPNNHRRQAQESDKVWLFITGNCAVHRIDFTRVRGFDENIPLWGWEDHDLAYRLQATGIYLQYIPLARAIMLWSRDDEVRSLETNRDYLIQKYGAWPPSVWRDE